MKEPKRFTPDEFESWKKLTKDKLSKLSRDCSCGEAMTFHPFYGLKASYGFCGKFICKSCKKQELYTDEEWKEYRGG